MEGDGCDICKPAMKKILKISGSRHCFITLKLDILLKDSLFYCFYLSEQLNCENRGNETAVACPVTNTRAYSRPILLQVCLWRRKI